MRMSIWAWNPSRDDAPPLKINLELDKYEPFCTCNGDSTEILKYKVLPISRAGNFLKSITSFVGLIKSFTNPGLSLYYTLTRTRQFKNSELTWISIPKPSQCATMAITWIHFEKIIGQSWIISSIPTRSWRHNKNICYREELDSESRG